MIRSKSLLLSSILTAIVFLCSTTLLLGQPSPTDNCGSPGWSEPTLTAHVKPSGFVRSLPATAPERYRNFHGLVIEEVTVMEIYPVMPMVFFDEGRSSIPSGYHLFLSAAETAGFADTVDPGELADTILYGEMVNSSDRTLMRQLDILNVIGYRMRKNPAAKISIGGYDSKQPALDETSRVAEARAKAVFDYLRNIWQIDPRRIQMVPSGGYPRIRSNTKNPVTNSENRRVEILSDDWEIIKPILARELRRYIEFGGVRFEMGNGVPDSLVARREIEITRKGRRWFTMRNLGLADQYSPAYEWGTQESADSIPRDQAPYVAQLVIYTKDGGQCRSRSIEIPVMIVTEERRRDEFPFETTQENYRLLLFDFEKSDLGLKNQRIINEYISSGLRQGAKIYITGYSSAEAKPEKLSVARANAVADMIRKQVKSGIFSTLTTSGEGDQHPLYENDFPEGRFLNRIVQVKIVTPPGVED